MSRKYWPIQLCEFLYEIGKDFLDINKIYFNKLKDWFVDRIVFVAPDDHSLKRIYSIQPIL